MRIGWDQSMRSWRMFNDFSSWKYGWVDIITLLNNKCLHIFQFESKVLFIRQFNILVMINSHRFLKWTIAFKCRPPFKRTVEIHLTMACEIDTGEALAILHSHSRK